MVKDNKTADTFRIEGNSLYHESKIYDALVCYNKSLCFALPKSKQMAVAYANRSAVYMRLQLYDQSLENIQLARDNNYPNESTLREFERDCLLLKMDHHPDPENDASSFFKLSYPAKEKLPFIANCLELRQDLKYGRHIATNQDLNPGDVIAIEKPFFKVVHKAGRYKRCTNCLKFNMLNLIPCDGDCSSCECFLPLFHWLVHCLFDFSAMFCNQKCMTKARKRFHHAECNSYFDNLLGDATEEGFPLLMLTIQRRLLQSLEIAQSIDSLRELMNDAEPKTVFDFDLSVDDPSTDMTYLLAVNSLQVRSNSMAKEMYDQTIATHLSELDLPSFVDSEEDRKDLVKYTTRLMLISDRNGHGIQNSSGAAEGSGIFPFGSLFNHSCDPNLQQIVNENKLIFVVVKPIAKDEQLFITYK